MTKRLHSFRCNDDLWDAITAHAETVELSANEAMEQLIASKLGLSSEMKSEAIAEPIAGPIADLKRRVSALEKVIAGRDITPMSQPMSQPIAKAISKPIAANSLEWMTTGEALEAMKQRHRYSASPGTFRRHLRTAQEQQIITPSLSNGGVIGLDFAMRAAANPKSNAVRWIKVS